MKFELTSTLRGFFFKNHFLELEDVIDPSVCGDLQKKADTLLSQKLGANTPLEKATEEELYVAGRDLFRLDDEMQKFVCKRQFAELFSELTHKRPLRLLYTQYLRNVNGRVKNKPLLDYLHTDVTLQESSPFQGIYGAVIVTLETHIGDSPHVELNVEDDISIVRPTASRVGNIVFIGEESPVSFAPLYEEKSEAHLLIAFGDPNAVYRKSETDPLAHHPKTLGYSFGDTLKDELHPIVYR